MDKTETKLFQEIIHIIEELVGLNLVKEDFETALFTTLSSLSINADKLLNLSDLIYKKYRVRIGMPAIDDDFILLDLVEYIETKINDSNGTINHKIGYTNSEMTKIVSDILKDVLELDEDPEYGKDLEDYEWEEEHKREFKKRIKEALEIGTPGHFWCYYYEDLVLALRKNYRKKAKLEMANSEPPSTVPTIEEILAKVTTILGETLGNTSIGSFPPDTVIAGNWLISDLSKNNIIKRIFITYDVTLNTSFDACTPRELSEIIHRDLKHRMEAPGVEIVSLEAATVEKVMDLMCSLFAIDGEDVCPETELYGELSLEDEDILELAREISRLFKVSISMDMFENFSTIQDVAVHIDDLKKGNSSGDEFLDDLNELLKSAKEAKTAEDFIKIITELDAKTKNLQQQTDTNMAIAQGKEVKEKKANLELKHSDVKVAREGSQIILPLDMSYDEGIVWLQRKKEAEERVVEIFERIPCFPLDGLYALTKAMKEIYGFTDLQNTPGFFGPTPPMILQIELSDGSYAHAPLGRIEPPTFEGGYIETQVGMEPALMVVGSIKRKFQGQVDAILKLTKKFLLEDSIYKGKAVMLDLGYAVPDVEGGPVRKFHPLNDAPKFMQIGNITDKDVILNEVTKFELSSNLFTLIEKSEACKKNGVPLKHGCLLAGPYGTGKTMVARLTARKSMDNGWTFLYVKNSRHTAKALKLAELYSPAVVFIEDIDQVTNGQRTGALNELMNTLDGIDTKHQPIITVMTTNHVEMIQQGVVRAGRIDSVVNMDAPDKDTAQEFVHLYAKSDNGDSLLAAGSDLTKAGELLSGFVPSFIAEAVHKAKKYAIHTHGADITGKVTSKDIEIAALSLKKHAELTKRKEEPTRAEVVTKAVLTIGDAFINGE